MHVSRVCASLGVSRITTSPSGGVFRETGGARKWKAHHKNLRQIDAVGSMDIDGPMFIKCLSIFHFYSLVYLWMKGIIIG